MRGEYKVPGGKLVAVDLEVAGDRLTAVSVSGDFFLEPEEALADVNAAITGQSVESSVDHLAATITASVGPDTAFIGFSPEAVGIAVRRALGKATGWDDHTFDVIGPVTLAPAMHVALDEVIGREVAAGTRPPTFRIWDWDSPLVVMGSFQSYVNEIDPVGAERHGIDVVRRVSGGGAMFIRVGKRPTTRLTPSTQHRRWCWLPQWRSQQTSPTWSSSQTAKTARCGWFDERPQVMVTDHRHLVPRLAARAARGLRQWRSTAPQNRQVASRRWLWIWVSRSRGIRNDLLRLRS